MQPVLAVLTASILTMALYGAYRVKSGAWCRVSSSISWPEARSSLRDGPRGARHRARTSRHRLVFGGPEGIPTMMQSSASAAKLRGGGPILNRGARAMRNSGVPPPRSSTAAHHSYTNNGLQDLEPFFGMEVVTPPGAGPDLPASRRWSPAARARAGASGPGPRSWPCASRRGRPRPAPGTSAPARCPSGRGGTATPAGSSHAAPARCPPWRAPSRAALVPRAGQPGVARHGPPVPELARQDLVHQHVGRLD